MNRWRRIIQSGFLFMDPDRRARLRQRSILSLGFQRVDLQQMPSMCRLDWGWR